MSNVSSDTNPSRLLGAAQLLARPAEEFVNHGDVETLWAIKASEHMEVYFRLLKSIDPKLLRLTPLDQQLLDDFNATFGNKIDVAKLDETSLKSEESKALWRDFCNRYEDLVEDFNFATIVRLDSTGDYCEENTILVPRVQFYAIEIARNRGGFNDAIRAKDMRPINLFCSALGATALCEKCAVDGYSVTNLISEDDLLRRKGALLEHFIRPPVDIDFTLPCPSDIAFIKIKLARASSVIQRLQVWTQNVGQNHWMKLSTVVDAGNEVVMRCGQVLPPYLSIDSTFGQSDPEVVKQLRSVARLRITVLAMKDRVAVSLPGCEALGVPSRHVPLTHPIFSKIKGKLNRATGLQQSASAPANGNAWGQNNLRKSPNRGEVLRNSGRTHEPHDRTFSSNTDSMPEEFLDPITIAVMTIPVGLPSGNIVDQSTLDRHVANENRWGRPASDPFTGVPLKNRPPVLTELKSRIDNFLTKSGSTSGVRAADGRNVARRDVSRLVAMPTSVSKVQTTARTEANGEIGPNVTLSTDLKTAFAQALATARKVLNRAAEDSQEGDSKRVKLSCANCDSLERNYKLTCGHTLCRQCAVLEATAKCRLCGTESLRADIVKINLI
ncbi:RING finger protein 37-like [Tropilaelaps mercedesae]|uniref:RING finger protein 37-like n=1 Tax=Tropilaelaps mercedesae TaxID=418985 RepID=A0A1V9XMV4_9ACAR|nr:RING finger protein 37-like [Tropilaelaps mercedesae]